MSSSPHTRPDDPIPITRAWERARADAERAGVTIRELDTVGELTMASVTWSRVWGRGPAGPMIPTEMLRAMTHAGNYAAGVFRDGHLVGAAFGFLGQHAGAVHLHSHIAGLLDAVRNRGVGRALKVHQRAWALQRGVETITWTFDPLVRRNAYFNLAKLGATADAYEVDFYGTMNDGINGQDDTDRLVVTWDLLAPRVATALETGHVPGPDVDASSVLLDQGPDGQPVVTDGDGPVLRVWVPDDIVALRRRDAAVAARWRVAVRDTLGAALDDGYRAVGMTRDGWYLLATESGPTLVPDRVGTATDRSR